MVQTATRVLKMYVRDLDQEIGTSMPSDLPSRSTLPTIRSEGIPLIIWSMGGIRDRRWRPRYQSDVPDGAIETRGDGVIESSDIISSPENKSNVRLREVVADRASQHNEDVGSHQIEAGSRVWLCLDRVKEGYARTLAQLWHGPFQVAEKINEFSIKLEIAGNGYQIIPLVHVSKLKSVKDFIGLAANRTHGRRIRSDRVDFDGIPLPEDSWVPDLGADEYEVERISDETTVDSVGEVSHHQGNHHRDFLREIREMREEESRVHDLKKVSCHHPNRLHLRLGFRAYPRVPHPLDLRFRVDLGRAVIQLGGAGSLGEEIQRDLIAVDHCLFLRRPTKINPEESAWDFALNLEFLTLLGRRTGWTSLTFRHPRRLTLSDPASEMREVQTHLSRITFCQIPQFTKLVVGKLEICHPALPSLKLQANHHKIIIQLGGAGSLGEEIQGDLIAFGNRLIRTVSRSASA
ncbi:hypothetical protein PHMEG_00021236 [Phytophthora megakarya]|uniref:Reverse transcriptase n=1 Tax=Phytophthora megakarya TaxID=4795 RepID=A0A225VME2_9STRA|nr:hypothetical protein PHMEG_00021236 [Phytophthora megakarya]